MVKKLFYLFLIAGISLAGLFSVAFARGTLDDPEQISYFQSSMQVNTDNSVDVTEEIGCGTGPNNVRHGIYRDIYPYSSESRKMSIENVSVVDREGHQYKFTVSNSGKYVRIKIGDPDTTFTGSKIYIIRYHATNAVAHLENVDEIYWNVTGNAWNIPIIHTEFKVTLPQGVESTQSACYMGTQGSTEPCMPSDNIVNNTYAFTTSRQLNPSEGLTVAVGFPKGIVTSYQPGEGTPTFWDTYLVWIISIALPLITLIISAWYWYKKGRDPRGTGVIIAQYDVPDNLTPMEVAGIVHQRVSRSDMPAEIIYLATQGYISIAELKEKNFIGFTSTDYKFTKLKNVPSDFTEHDQKLMNALFGATDSIKLSQLKQSFYSKARNIIDSVLKRLLSKGYYKNLGKMKQGFTGIIVFILIGHFILQIFKVFDVQSFLQSSIFPYVVSLFISLIIYLIFFQFSPAKTEKGITTQEYLLGLKLYLQIAEKDRLEFHNAPEKKPEIFEKLLPYAMVLGVVDIWAKEFADIYTTPPSWYSGTTGANFNAVIFAHSITNFNSFTNSSLGGASGSGGGGFSGGGGGGGGGGSW